ncbi:MAG TPA: hypothetical protein V6C64_01350, partial [Microcoleaceae cyanobacterium]
EIAARLGSRTAQSVGRGLSSGISEFGGHAVSSDGRSPHPDTDTEPSTSTTTSHPDETSTTAPPHPDGTATTPHPDEIPTTPPHPDGTATTPHPDETSSTPSHPDEVNHTPPPEPRSLPSDDTIPDATPHPTSDEEPTIPDGRSPDLDDEPTIPNGRVPTDTTPSHPLTPGHDAYPEGLVHYGLTAEEAHSSYRVSLEEDPSREAGIWMDPTNGEHIVVQGGADFVSTGWSSDSDFANRPWRLVEHFHPGDDSGARFASVDDFASMMHPQLSGQAEPAAISTRVRWRDPESHIEFITEIGYDPGQSEPYWIRYRDAHGEWQTQRFSDTPWNAGSDYIRFLQSQGIPQPTIPSRSTGPSASGGHTTPPDVSAPATGTSASRPRHLISPDMIQEPTAPHPETGARSWDFSLTANVNGETITWGLVSVNLDENGNPSSPPSMYLDTRVLVGGEPVILDLPEGLSFTRIALDQTNAAYRRAFGHEPENLGGNLADLNLLNFRRSYTRLRTENPDWSRDQLAQAAIREISFGRHRADIGYSDFSVTLGDDTPVVLQEGQDPQSVPSRVDVIARRPGGSSSVSTTEEP